MPLALALATDALGREAILLAANVGGDSDSVASIAGGILAPCILARVNQQWCDVVESVNGHGLAAIAVELTGFDIDVEFHGLRSQWLAADHAANNNERQRKPILRRDKDKGRRRLVCSGFRSSACVVLLGVFLSAQDDRARRAPPDEPAVTVRGQTYATVDPGSNMGTEGIERSRFSP